MALNITVVPTGASGDLRIFPYGGTPPDASIVNFYPGSNLANAANVAIAFMGGTNDVTINIDYGTDVFLIVDVMGYFAPPVATPLQKTSVTYYYSAPANSSYYVWVNCPAGYTLTGGGFIGSGSILGNWVTASYSSENSWYVVATNTTSSPVTIGSHGVCSRVPGR